MSRSAKLSGSKACTKCGIIKDVRTCFYRRRHLYDSDCMECNKKSSMAWRLKNSEKHKETKRNYYLKNKVATLSAGRAWRTANPRKVKAYNLEYHRGITLERYEAMLSSQGGKCAGCEVHYSKTKKRLAVDHDHQTGEIRGLLCHRCNTSIGLLDENPKTLWRLLKYIQKTN